MKLEGTLSELFSIRIYRNNLLIIVIIWSYCSYAFTMIPLYIGNANLDFYIVCLSLGMAEILADLTCLYAKKLGETRTALVIFFLIGFLGSIGTLALELFTAETDNG